MRLIGVTCLAVVLASCTSVKIVQRDGCWIRRTERKLGGVTEEIGPCMRPEPKWVDDRLTRVVQECIAQADYRWQAHALAVWSRGDPLPAPPDHDAVVRDCLGQGTTGIVAENETLKKRVQEIASDRDRLRTGADQDRDRLRQSADRLTDYLGAAAKKPPGNAFATANSTSDGSASTENRAGLAGSPPGPAMPIDPSAATPADRGAPHAGSNAAVKGGTARQHAGTRKRPAPKPDGAAACEPHRSTGAAGAECPPSPADRGGGAR